MAFKTIYATSRDWRFDNPINLDGTTMNGGYPTTFFNQGQFADFARANIVKLSMPITDLSRYTGKIPVIDPVTEEPTGEFVPKLTRFVVLRYSDVYTNAEDLTASIEKTGSNTGVQVFPTPEAAAQWIRDNTDLEEDPQVPGKFLLSPERESLMPDRHTIPAQYLEIA